MKLLVLSFFAAIISFGLGCSSTGGSQQTDEPEANLMGSEESPDQSKTAYDGSTGSGLLMERYKSGEISGFQD